MSKHSKENAQQNREKIQRAIQYHTQQKNWNKVTEYENMLASLDNPLRIAEEVQPAPVIKMVSDVAEPQNTVTEEESSVAETPQRERSEMERAAEIFYHFCPERTVRRFPTAMAPLAYFD